MQPKAQAPIGSCPRFSSSDSDGGQRNGAEAFCSRKSNQNSFIGPNLSPELRKAAQAFTMRLTSLNAMNLCEEGRQASEALRVSVQASPLALVATDGYRPSPNKKALGPTTQALPL